MSLRDLLALANTPLARVGDNDPDESSLYDEIDSEDELDEEDDDDEDTNDDEKVVAIVSGGMDSVTLAYDFNADHELYLLSFDYGQRHKKELLFAQLVAKTLGASHRVVDLQTITELLSASKSSLVSDTKVPDGHYTNETMKQTVVPNRNAIMLSIAFGYAASIGAKHVATAVHAGDHFIYPDCRPKFADAFNLMEFEALRGLWNVQLRTPYIHISKADIVRIGARCGVPYALSWSCYKGDEIHCGRCGTCVERAEAFDIAGVPDPTEYADPNFWREACNRG